MGLLIVRQRVPPVTDTHALFAEQSQSILENLMEIIGRLCAVPKSRAMPPGACQGYAGRAIRTGLGNGALRRSASGVAAQLHCALLPVDD